MPRFVRGLCPPTPPTKGPLAFGNHIIPTRRVFDSLGARVSRPLAARTAVLRRQLLGTMDQTLPLYPVSKGLTAFGRGVGGRRPPTDGVSRHSGPNIFSARRPCVDQVGERSDRERGLPVDIPNRDRRHCQGFRAGRSVPGISLNFLQSTPKCLWNSLIGATAAAKRGCPGPGGRHRVPPVCAGAPVARQAAHPGRCRRSRAPDGRG